MNTGDTVEVEILKIQLTPETLCDFLSLIKE